MLFAAVVAHAGQLGANPNRVDFGDVAEGQSETETITVTNTGTSNLTVSKYSVSGAVFSVSGLSIPTTLRPHASVSFNAEFSPTGPGSSSGSISIVTSPGDATTVIALTGVGVTSAVVQLSSASLSFANQTAGTTSPVQTVTLSDTGSATLSIASVSISGTDSGDFAQSNTCGSSVPAGGNCTISVTFTPSAAGSLTASLSITDSAANSPQAVSLSGTGIAAVLTVTPSSVEYGDVELNKTSLQKMTITNTGTNSVTVSQASVTGTGFGISGLSLPQTLSLNQEITFNLSFDPATTGGASGTLTVTSTAPNSPNIVSAAGYGIPIPVPVCTGIPISQDPVNVTSILTGVLEGLTVTQATTLSGGGSGSWNTYADLPSYSAPTNVMVYNYGLNPAAVASANLDGTNAQIISGTAQGTETTVTPDGKFAFYQGQNPSQSADIYAVPLAQSGSCVQNRLTNLQLVPIAPEGALVISNASPDSTGHNIIAFSSGLVLHRVYDDGTLLTPDPITLPDPENTDVLHRMRLNPKFPNIMWYKRDDPAPNPGGTAQREIWVIDLNNPSKVYSLMGADPTNPGVDHAYWSNDGTQLGFIYGGYWWVTSVVSSDGTLNLGDGKFALPAGWPDSPLGPTRSSGLTVDYCNLAPDGSVYVCAEGVTDIYLMSLDGTQTKELVNPDALGANFNGLPKPQFLDIEHILFSSDRTVIPQVYVMTGFTTTFP